MDPFTGSSTTGIAANLLGRRFLGIDQEELFLQISKARKEEIVDVIKRNEYIDKIQKQTKLFSDNISLISDIESIYTFDLPF